VKNPDLQAWGFAADEGLINWGGGFCPTTVALSEIATGPHFPRGGFFRGSFFEGGSKTPGLKNWFFLAQKPPAKPKGRFACQTARSLRLTLLLKESTMLDRG
jgi:hypothetical protein